MTCYLPASVGLAVWGDPVVSRALVLLLRGSGYDARFLNASFLGEPGLLEGIQLLLITPTPKLNTKRRKALLGALRDTPEAVRIAIVELVTTFGGTGERGARERWESVVPWPCRTEELERRIEATLLASRAESLACRSPRTLGGKNEAVT